jgi:uncharacterized protein YjbI with pentapeptide repeats
MKAQEVLRRYAGGERNFRNTNLRGANFKGQDLSGADFSGSDIRSANFTNATLRDANFTQAQGGLQRRWLAIQLCFIGLLAGISGMFQGVSGSLVEAIFFGSVERRIASCVYVAMVVLAFTAIALEGFKVRTLGAILVVCQCVYAFAFLGAFPHSHFYSFTVAFNSIPSLVIFVAILAGVFVCAGTGLFVFSLAFAGAVAVIVPFSNSTVGAAIGVAVAVTSLLLSLYIAQQVLEENKKFAIIRLLGLPPRAPGSTSFCGADLARATFSQAQLKNTNFNDSHKLSTRLSHVCWQGADGLDLARLGDSILQDRRVRILLTTPEKGYKQDLTDANLWDANLKSTTLEKATLKGALLLNANLENAILKDAILTKAIAEGANFTGACLTGVTLESWYIDSTTILKNIDCQYVFLLEKPNEKGDRERRPYDLTKNFQPGDFETLCKEMLSLAGDKSRKKNL